MFRISADAHVFFAITAPATQYGKPRHHSDAARDSRDGSLRCRFVQLEWRVTGHACRAAHAGVRKVSSAMRRWHSVSDRLIAFSDSRGKRDFNRAEAPMKVNVRCRRSFPKLSNFRIWCRLLTNRAVMRYRRAPSSVTSARNNAQINSPTAPQFSTSIFDQGLRLLIPSRFRCARYSVLASARSNGIRSLHRTFRPPAAD